VYLRTLGIDSQTELTRVRPRTCPWNLRRRTCCTTRLELLLMCNAVRRLVGLCVARSCRACDSLLRRFWT
jgi:hypothetical protein